MPQPLHYCVLVKWLNSCYIHVNRSDFEMYPYFLFKWTVLCCSTYVNFIFKDVAFWLITLLLLNFVSYHYFIVMLNMVINEYPILLLLLLLLFIIYYLIFIIIIYHLLSNIYYYYYYYSLFIICFYYFTILNNDNSISNGFVPCMNW
jgi:hypothetical protein